MISPSGGGVEPNNSNGFGDIITSRNSKHLACQKSIKRCAFTMAELLITIGIIGVVAAITISALGLNVSSKKFQTQLKKSLSTLDQAAISAQARYYTDYSSLSTESNDSTCSSDKLASGNQTMCALFNTTLSAKSYLGVYGTSVRSFIGLGLYRINAHTINPDGYLVYSLSDGSFVGFNPKAKNCSIGAGTSFTSEFLTEGNLSDCLGFIDVNGASLPNREVLCSEGETVLDPLSQCKVKNVKGDVFPVVFHDGKVEPASNAARLAFFWGNNFVAGFVNYELSESEESNNNQPSYDYDGTLYNATPNGYKYFKYIPGDRSWDKAMESCPEGTEIPKIEDLISLYCEAKGSSARYTGGNCSNYTKNEDLANILVELGTNWPAKDGTVWSSSPMSYDNEYYGLSADGTIQNRGETRYNRRVICMGK